MATDLYFVPLELTGNEQVFMSKKLKLDLQRVRSKLIANYNIPVNPKNHSLNNLCFTFMCCQLCRPGRIKCCTNYIEQIYHCHCNTRIHEKCHKIIEHLSHKEHLEDSNLDEKQTVVKIWIDQNLGDCP